MNPAEDSNISNEDPGKDRLEQARQELEKTKDVVMAAQEKVEGVLASTAFSTFWGRLKSWIPGLHNLGLEAIEKWVKTVFSIVLRGISSLIMFLLMIGIFSGINDTNYIFKDFNVPEHFEQMGVSGEVLKIKIMDRAAKLRESYAKGIRDTIGQANNQQEKRQTYNLAAETKVPEEDVEIMGVSLLSVKGVIRSLLGKENIIVTGNLVKHENEPVLDLHVSRNGRNVVSLTPKDCKGDEEACLDNLIEQAAVHSLSIQDPLLIAFYYYMNDDREEALSLLESALLPIDWESESNDDHLPALEKAKGFNIWGRILAERADSLRKSPEPKEEKEKKKWQLEVQKTQKSAAEKYERATKLDSQLVQAWVNWGDLLFEEIGVKKFEGPPKMREGEGHKLEKKDSLLITQTARYYLKGESIHNKRKVSQAFTPAYFGEALFYYGWIKDDSTLVAKSAETLKQSVISDRSFYSPKDYYTWGERFAGIGAKKQAVQFYALYLDYQRKSKSYEDWELSEQNVTEKKQLIDILKFTLRNISREPTQAYNGLLEQLIFLQWDLTQIDEDPFAVDVSTQLYGFNPEHTDVGDTFSWSEATITPDPRLTGEILDVEDEQLWYYLRDKYDRYLFFDMEGTLLTQASTYLDSFQLYINSPNGEKGLGAKYENLHDQTYEDWLSYRSGTDFKGAISYNHYRSEFDKKENRAPNTPLTFEEYLQYYQAFLQSAKRNEAGFPVDSSGAVIDTLQLSGLDMGLD